VKKLSVLLSIVLLLAGCTNSSATSMSADDSDAGLIQNYDSCDQLNLDYIGGVSRTGATNVGPLPLFDWVEDDQLFDRVQSLDIDGDGIACELTKLTDELRNALAGDGELSTEEQLIAKLSDLDWPRAGQKCGSLDGPSEDAIGYSSSLVFVVLRCDQNMEWQPRLNADGTQQLVELDQATGFPSEVVNQFRLEIEETFVATQAIDVPINRMYTEGEKCGGGYGWQVLGYNKSGDPAFLKCPNGDGKFVVDNESFKIDPITMMPLVKSTLPKYQRMAYSPHVYIIPQPTDETPKTTISDVSDFSNVEPCKVKDLDNSPDKSFGFPLPATSAVLKENFKVLVLPVQFPDYPSSNNPNDDIADVKIELSRYYERMASSQISFDWTIPDTYRMLDKELVDYNLGGPGDFYKYYVPYIQDAVEAYDSDYSFDDFDIVIVEEPRNVTDSVHPMYVPAIRGNDRQFQVSSDEGPVPRVLITGNDEIRDIPNWIHEFGHLLGLPDRNWYVGAVLGFDIMFGWYGSPEMSIWLRWLLGIASDDQVSCVTSPEASTHWIRPVAWDGNYLKGVVIPIDSSTVLVAESRRRLGYDALAGESGEGVYVYRIDTRAKMYQSDTRILVDSVRPDRSTITQNDWSFDSPLKPGESVISDGWEIKSLESGDYGDVIQVTKVSN
jgi:M6 family metalloprotease-like protein